MGVSTGVESEYERWAEQFEVHSRQSEISQLLVNCPHVRSLHSGLVPAKVSYNDFWKRYFFKLGLLQQVSDTGDIESVLYLELCLFGS